MSITVDGTTCISNLLFGSDIAINPATGLLTGTATGVAGSAVADGANGDITVDSAKSLSELRYDTLKQIYMSTSLMVTLQTEQSILFLRMKLSGLLQC